MAELLVGLLEDSSNHALRAAHAHHQDEYQRLTRHLLDYRGYGPDVGENPLLQFDFKELLAWLKAHRPAVFDEVLLDYVAPDVAVFFAGGKWHWSTLESPRYVLCEDLSHKESARPLPSRQDAVAEASSALKLAETVPRHFANNSTGAWLLAVPTL